MPPRGRPALRPRRLPLAVIVARNLIRRCLTVCLKPTRSARRFHLRLLKILLLLSLNSRELLLLCDRLLHLIRVECLLPLQRSNDPIVIPSRTAVTTQQI